MAIRVPQNKRNPDRGKLESAGSPDPKRSKQGTRAATTRLDGVPLPYLRVKVGDKNAESLIDSASTHNFIKESLTDDATPVSQNTAKAKLAEQGKTMLTRGVCQIQITVGSVSDTIDFTVAPDLDGDLTLGRPWLRRNRALHDYGEDCLYFGRNARQKVYFTRKHIPRPPDLASILNGIRHEFPEKHAEQFHELITRHASIFDTGRPLRQIDFVEHRITLREPKPFRVPPYRYSAE